MLRVHNYGLLSLMYALSADTLCCCLQCATFLGWITGMHPPGKTLNVVTAGRVLINKLKAHTEAYHAIKATPVGAGVVVGLVHHHITFMATGPSILSALAK